MLFAFFFGLVLASILTIGVKVRWNMKSAAMLDCWYGRRLHHRQCRAGRSRSLGALPFVSGMIAIPR